MTALKQVSMYGRHGIRHGKHLTWSVEYRDVRAAMLLSPVYSLGIDHPVPESQALI